MKSLLASAALALSVLAGGVPAAAATISAVVTPAPAPSSDIGARIRWGGTGFEASVYDSNPLNQSPTLNPSGAPVWQTGLAYAFEVIFDGLTGTLGLKVDFNRDNSFSAGESISRNTFAAPGQTSYQNFAFRYLSISGNESGSTARSTLTNLVINGVGQSNITPNGAFTETFFARGDLNPVSSWNITGEITFLNTGTSQERPAWDFRFRDPSPIPVPAALPLMLLALGSLGLVARRRRAA